jgi:hypothetical protein
MRRSLTSVALALGLLLGLGGTALAGQPVKTTIWLDGALVRTILPPAASPQDGTDPFYMVPGTGGVAAVGPGDAGYHGGRWQVYLVSWNVAMVPLTSDEAIAEAATAGDITITRAAELDFLCPIQP